MVAALHGRNDELDDLTLARAKKGDPAARLLLVKTYQRQVYALAGRMMVKRPSLVDDLAQESFLKVFEALPRFDTRGPAKLSTWIFTITTRVCIDAHRRAKHPLSSGSVARASEDESDGER